MDLSSPYYKAHIIVAAIRLMNHKNNAPPMISEIADNINYSLEEVRSLVNKLEKMGVIEVILSGTESRIFVDDPAPLEKLPREGKTSMEKDIINFAAKQKADMDNIKVKAMDEKSRKKDLFAALEAQLKEKFNKDKLLLLQI